MLLNGMNGKLIFSYLILLSLCCEAQTSKYHPFPEGTGIWKHDWTVMCGQSSSNFSCKSGYQYIQKGDTIILSKHYTKLYKEGWQNGCSHYPYYCTNPIFYNNYHGATRNDTTGKKVLYVAANTTTETILYDFSLKIGDTLKSFACDGHVITSIDSLLVGNSYRKTLIAGYIYNIIEGIGSVGVVDHYGWGDMFTCFVCACPYYWTFKCFSENGAVKLGDPNYSIYTTIQTNNINALLKVYPNPSHSSFIFELSNGMQDAQVFIYNSLGDLVKAEYLTEPSVELNLELLSDGLYYYTLEKEGAIITTGKLFKQ
jgi:hypothetical protein